MKKLLLFTAMLLFFCLSLAAQEEPESAAGSIEQGFPPEPAEEAEIEADEETFFQNNNIIELDIRTSSLMELASWAGSLGLSSGGTRDEIANRLRNYYGLPAPGMTVPPGQRTIVIESARTTEYFTL